MSLYAKALDCAIKDLRRCTNRDTANAVYLKWKALHKDTRFKNAVEEKKKELKQ